MTISELITIIKQIELVDVLGALALFITTFGLFTLF